MSSALHICRPAITRTKLARFGCLDCAGGYRYGPRRVAPRVERPFCVGWHAEWYGWHIVCLRCGAEYQDGEQLPRPFEPKWRECNIERAKERWRRGARA